MKTVKNANYGKNCKKNAKIRNPNNEKECKKRPKSGILKIKKSVKKTSQTQIGQKSSKDRSPFG